VSEGAPGCRPGPGSFESFYETELPQLIIFLVKQGASWDDAFDVGQECCVKAFERWHKISEPATWIRTTAVREYCRRQARSREEITRALCGGWEPRPHFDKLDVHAEEAAVYEAIASLPPRQAEVMAWTYDGYQPAEIAKILTGLHPHEPPIAPEAIRASLYQARKTLKTLLGPKKEA